VTSEGIGTDPEKVAAIAELEPPSTVKELRQNLGVASSYAIGRYASERMVPTAEQLSGARRSRILRPQTSQYVGCRPYC